MLLFRRKRMNDNLMKGASPGSLEVPSDTGWMDSRLFVVYLKHFIKHANPSESKPILLLLDGHQSHKSLNVIDLAKDNYITLLTLPPHTSNRLQPLDVSFFGPLKAYYNKEIDKWMLRHPGKRATDFDICILFSPAYLKTASVERAAVGFNKMGICPYDPEVFDYCDYVPSLVTDRPLDSSSPATTAISSGATFLSSPAAQSNENLVTAHPGNNISLAYLNFFL